MERIKNFFSNTNLHGFAYLTDDEVKQFMILRIFRKLFWGVVIILSVMGLSKILYTTLEDFYSDIVIINMDTNYLRWINTFPAVSICFRKGLSTRKISKFITKYWDDNNITERPNMRAFTRTLQNYIFISSTNLIDNVNEACEVYNSTCGVDLDYLRKKLLPNDCHEFIYDLKIFGKDVKNCSKYFKFHKTEMGFCFTANSIYGQDNLIKTRNFEKLPITFKNTDNVDFELQFRYIELPTVSYEVFVHSPDELPYYHSSNYVLGKTDLFTYMSFKIEEIVNEAGVREQTIEDRNCRFVDELIMPEKIPYSISNCMYKYRVENEIKHCNCTIPTSPYPDLYKPICGYFQLECLTDSRVANKLEKLGERCLPTCSKMEIHNVGYYEEDREGEALVLIKLQNRPTLRHVRRINTDKSMLDLVVGVGGIAGLFFGASILSIFEIFYLILRRN